MKPTHTHLDEFIRLLGELYVHLPIQGEDACLRDRLLHAEQSLSHVLDTLTLGHLRLGILLGDGDSDFGDFGMLD